MTDSDSRLAGLNFIYLPDAATVKILILIIYDNPVLV